MTLAKQIILPLKTKGLCKKSIQTAIATLDGQSTEDPKVIKFKKLFKAYLIQYECFVKHTAGVYNISSDIIESMFGTYKNMVSQNPLAGVTLLSLELPIHCMSEQQISNDMKGALENVFMSHLQQWLDKHSSESQIVKRHDFFNKKT